MNDQDQQDHNRAEQARQIIENDLVVFTLARMRRDIYELWADTSLNAEQREELHRQHMALERFVAAFDVYLQNGAQARAMLGLPAESKSFWQRITEHF
ncbi:hypothetical protein [Allopusillimonas ginsengisoli]|uniref:hypothetical protein n=1 Tax=Allopusillimonas ginsengisoli TaxID=453575 RepID=UPI001020399D|nr:hypothetical protein [Allopusillimonas ginsengisoli]TEA78646.1 hypothetical protein ERE07_09630 [Allopusillimonas ginsengisoli]